MEILFTIVPLFIGFVFVMVVAGSISQMMQFNSVFKLILKRISDATAEEAARAAKPCGHCGMTIPAAELKCPSCGAAR